MTVAIAGKIEGVVVATIGGDGKVRHGRILGSVPFLNDAAVAAVRVVAG